MSRAVSRVALAVGAFVCLTAAVTSAQQATSATETKKFEVIAVDGNQLVVKLPEGTKELTVPDDFRFTVDGQQLSVRELKPGMAGTATITTTTVVTPVTVTEVKNGTVQQVTGSSIIVRTDEGFKMFTQGEVDKRGVKIMRHGKPAQLSEFHSGDKLSATIITTMPPKVVTEKEVQANLARGGAGGAAPAPASRATSGAATPAATGGSTAGAGEPAPAPAKKLPKTASPLPLVGLVGLASLLTGVALTVRRRVSR
jgi:hypothetical protein